MLALKHFPRLLDPHIDQIGGMRRFRLKRFSWQRRYAGGLRVGVADRGVQPFATQHEHEPVFFLRAQLDLHAGQLDAAQQIDHLLANLGRDTSGAPIGNQTGIIDRTEIAARSDIGRPQRQPYAKRRQNPPPHFKLDRVITKERQMCRAAPRRHPARHRDAQADRAFAGETVHIRRVGCLQLRRSALLTRQTAQAIHNEQQDLATVAFCQATHESKVSHCRSHPFHKRSGSSF